MFWFIIFGIKKINMIILFFFGVYLFVEILGYLKCLSLYFVMDNFFFCQYIYISFKSFGYEIEMELSGVCFFIYFISGKEWMFLEKC